MNTLGENPGGFTELPDATEFRVQAGQNLLHFSISWGLPES